MQMKLLMVASTVAAIAFSQAAFAQNQTSNSQASSQPSTNSNQNLVAAQQIQQDLKKAGFTDVKVVAESFVVQAKSKDGDPVLMTIGPHGMSVFEAMNSNSNAPHQSGTTGSTGSSQGTSSKYRRLLDRVAAQPSAGGPPNGSGEGCANGFAQSFCASTYDSDGVWADPLSVLNPRRTLGLLPQLCRVTLLIVHRGAHQHGFSYSFCTSLASVRVIWRGSTRRIRTAAKDRSAKKLIRARLSQFSSSRISWRSSALR
jgi:hypothetical protein